MKRWIAMGMAIVLAVLCVACGTQQQTSSETAEKDYVQILKDARSEQENEYDAIVSGRDGQAPGFGYDPSQVDEETAASTAAMMMDVLGLSTDMLDSYAFSMSLMNVRAYAVGIFMPAAGQQEAVVQALESYVTAQRKAFENYLPDQYAYAQDARVETLASGEVVIAMGETAGDTLSALKKALG